MNQSFTDYIAFTIRENLLSLDKRKVLDEVGKVQYDLGMESEHRAVVTTIDVLDMQGKAYRITVQEL